MNNYNNRAGKSTRDMADKRYKSRLWFVLPIAGIVLVILVVAFNSSALGIGGFGFLGLILLGQMLMSYMEAKAKRMMKEERQATRGAKAEEKIGLELDKLGENYLILHDIESPYGNIDHIVISQENGVFLIETKAHGGRVSTTYEQLLVNGHKPEKDFIAQVLRNTYWLRDAICQATNVEIGITPILVFTNAFVERIPPIKGVTVTNKKYLLNILQRPNPKNQNLAVWELGDQISHILCK
jgi:hypothetical protein